jgi:hypothetical protein
MVGGNQIGTCCHLKVGEAPVRATPSIRRGLGVRGLPVGRGRSREGSEPLEAPEPREPQLLHPVAEP